MTAGPTPPFFVITGGPGSGKTTLIEALAATGLATAAEAGRQVIIEERQSSGRALPWVDPRAFAEAMLVRDVDSYAAWRDATGPVFFDRGIPDVIGYLRLESVLVPPAMLHAARIAIANLSSSVRPGPRSTRPIMSVSKASTWPSARIARWLKSIPNLATGS